MLKNTKIDSQDLIYNRFDVIGDNNTNLRTFLFSCNGKKYDVTCMYIDRIAYLNVWGKSIPEGVMDRILDMAEEERENLVALFVQRTANDYHRLLTKGEEAVLHLPLQAEELVETLSTKERSHIRQYKRNLEKIGKLEKILYEGDIPISLVSTFFLWKKSTHNYEYRITQEEYLKRFHVTDALELVLNTCNGRKPIAVIFWCQIDKTIYLENLSYDIDYKKYSPGYLAYIEFLKELVNRKCKYVFLGGAKYDYKRKFGTVIRECYTGYIFTHYGYRAIDYYFLINGYNKWAIWGCGNLGKTVIEINKFLKVKISFVIDREYKEDLVGINVFSPNEDWPDCDIVIITIKEKNKEIEDQLKVHGKIYTYYDEWIKEIIMMNMNAIR